MYGDLESVELVKEFINDPSNTVNERLQLKRVVDFELFEKWCKDNKQELSFNKKYFDKMLKFLFQYQQ